MSAAQIIEELPRLSPAERSTVENKLRELAALPRRTPTPTEREAWLTRLRAHRERSSTGRQGSSIQEIMDDIRGDR